MRCSNKLPEITLVLQPARCDVKINPARALGSKAESEDFLNKPFYRPEWRQKDQFSGQFILIFPITRILKLLRWEANILSVPLRFCKTF